MLARLIVILLLGAAAVQAGDGRTVRVGVFDNSPIVSRTPSGDYAGLAIDVLRETAAREDWQLEFHHGSLRVLMDDLQSGRVDLLVGVAYSDERAKTVRFTEETLLSNWGVVYRRPGAAVGSLLDLQDRRIAVMGGSIHGLAFERLMGEFGVRYQAVPVATYADVLAAVGRGEADAGVVNRLFSIERAADFNVHATPIIFNPVEVRYAAPATGSAALIAALDRHLGAMKRDPASRYYRSLERWLARPARADVPAWVAWGLGLAAGLIFLFLGMNLLLQRRVRQRTQALLDNSMRLRLEIGERERAQERLNRVAYFDELTGLPNRVLFQDRLRQALALAHRDNDRVAVMLLDVDRFKNVNDTLGHTAGDRVIRLIGERLSRALRDSDTMARLGGDEFTVLVTSVDTPEALGPLADRLMRACSLPMEIAGSEVVASASIGIAVYPDDAEDIDGLVKHADTAMYHAKSTGGNAYAFYTPQLTQRAMQRMELEGQLRHALERGELELYYQPIVALRDSAAVAVEALLRWQPRGRAPVSPADFIPIAEETGLIVPIGDWVLEQACHQIGRWRRQGISDLRVAVNVSYRQMERGRLFESVQNALRAGGVGPGSLELELTEGLFMEDPERVTSTLQKVAGLGVSVSIDDFGTGYSSLGYLKRLPIDTVKVDRTFVTDLPHDTDDAELATAIVGMAHGLRCRVVAEGIETQEQLQFLRAQGCDEGQGFLFSHPLPAAQCGAWLRANRRGTPQARSGLDERGA